ncbi:MAG TPA: outer membrane beta-barrel protein, partial [Flavobacteriales bacterium]
GGAQMASWRSAVMNYQPVPGLALGAYAPIWICPTLEAQPELLLSLQGSSLPILDGGRRSLHSLYAQVPFTLKLFVNRTFSIQGGYQGGYLLGAMSEGHDVADDLNSVDHGFLVGAGIDPRRGFDLTLRYYSGNSPLLANDAQIYPTSRVLQFTLGKRIAQFSHRKIRRH